MFFSQCKTCKQASVHGSPGAPGYTEGVCLNCQTKRKCVACEQDKAIDLDAKRNSKKSGFMGNVCWPCYIIRTRMRTSNPIGVDWRLVK